jgi:hypothetical protein
MCGAGQLKRCPIHHDPIGKRTCSDLFEQRQTIGLAISRQLPSGNPSPAGQCNYDPTRENMVLLQAYWSLGWRHEGGHYPG